jgi:hypothetical protein
VFCYHCYWAYIAHLLVPIYLGNYSPVSIIYNRVVTTELKVKREEHVGMQPGPHRHYGARAPAQAPQMQQQQQQQLMAAQAPAQRHVQQPTYAQQQAYPMQPQQGAYAQRV